MEDFLYDVHIRYLYNISHYTRYHSQSSIIKSNSEKKSIQFNQSASVCVKGKKKKKTGKQILKYSIHILDIRTSFISYIYIPTYICRQLVRAMVNI